MKGGVAGKMKRVLQGGCLALVGQHLEKNSS